jgi:hypothetical protein
MASQQATSLGFNTPWHLRKCLPVWQQILFRGHRRQLARKAMITVFFTAKKLIVFNVLPRDSTFNQLYFINDIFPDLKTSNLNFRRQKTWSTFSVHKNNYMCRHKPKLKTKTKKNHFSIMSHPPNSPDISPCDFWLFGMLKQILRDREFSSSDEIEDAIAQVWNDLTFDDVPSVIRDWIRHLAWVAERDRKHISE